MQKCTENRSNTIGHSFSLGIVFAFQPENTWLPEGIAWGAMVRIVLIVMATYLIVTTVSFLLVRLAARSQRRSDFIQKTIPFAGYAIWLMAILYILSGMLKQPSLLLAAVAGFFLVAALFASHSILRDVAAGLIILFERPFRIGKTIHIGSVNGVVEHIGLRSFYLRTNEGELVVLPNSEAIRQSVKIANPEAPEVMVHVDVPVPEKVPLVTAKDIVREAAAVSPYICSRRPIEVLVQPHAAGQAHQQIQIKAFVFDVRYANELRSDILEACRDAFSPPAQATSNEDRIAGGE